MIAGVGGPTHPCDNNPSTGAAAANQQTSKQKTDKEGGFNRPFAQQQGKKRWLQSSSAWHSEIIFMVVFCILLDSLQQRKGEQTEDKG